jgi:heat shock protein HtpX
MLRTAALMGLLTGILLAVGFVIAGPTGMTFFLGLAFVLNFLTYWYSDRIVLAMYRAKPVSRAEEPELHQIVERLARRAGIPKPRVYLIDVPTPNAFATGRSPKHAAVAISSSLLRMLSWDEVEGVLSHELAHIRARDTLISTIAATVAGAIAYIAQIAWWSLGWRDREGGSLLLFPLLILAPIAATLIRLAISRTREYAADYVGAITCKKPLSLASALAKISHLAERYPMRGNAACSHLFIVNPFKADSFTALFSTHPPIEERIRRLRQIKI